MLEVRVYRTIYPLRKAWKKLLSGKQKAPSIYLDYELNKVFFRRLPVYMIMHRFVPAYCLVLEDNYPVLIASLGRRINSKDYFGLGMFNGFQEYDFIYDDSMTSEKAKSCITSIQKKLHASSIMLQNVMDDSVIKKCDIPYSSISVNDNVNIHVGEDYDAWFASLSKHSRQNIRTAYNRVAKADITISLQVLLKEKVPNELKNQVINLYCERHASRYRVKTSAFKRFYLKYLDFSTIFQCNSNKNCWIILRMNGEIAAFLSGVINRENAVTVPRLTISDKYSFYSPGMILINESAKVIARDELLTELDLSKGAEEYKLAAGGQKYNSYQITINKK